MSVGRLNPVRRGLCERAVEWEWSVAGHHDAPDGTTVPPEDSGLPGP
jgi:hypothetical protein